MYFLTVYMLTMILKGRKKPFPNLNVISRNNQSFIIVTRLIFRDNCKNL